MPQIIVLGLAILFVIAFAWYHDRKKHNPRSKETGPELTITHLNVGLLADKEFIITAMNPQDPTARLFSNGGPIIPVQTYTLLSSPSEQYGIGIIANPQLPLYNNHPFLNKTTFLFPFKVMILQKETHD